LARRRRRAPHACRYRLATGRGITRGNADVRRSAARRQCRRQHPQNGALARPAETLDALAARAGSERLALIGKDIHLYVPEGYGRSKLSNAAIEKALGLRATTRNWNTVNRLYALSGA